MEEVNFYIKNKGVIAILLLPPWFGGVKPT